MWTQQTVKTNMYQMRIKGQLSTTKKKLRSVSIQCIKPVGMDYFLQLYSFTLWGYKNLNYNSYSGIISHVSYFSYARVSFPLDISTNKEMFETFKLGSYQCLWMLGLYWLFREDTMYTIDEKQYTNNTVSISMMSTVNANSLFPKKI